VAVPTEQENPFEVVGEPERPDSPVQSPDPDREAARSRRKARRRRRALDRVQTGISLVLVKILLQIAGILVTFALSQVLASKARGWAKTVAKKSVAGDAEVTGAVAPPSGVVAVARALFVARVLTELMPAVLGIIATGLCLAVPTAAGVRGYLVASIAFDVGYLIGIVLRLLGVLDGAPAAVVGLSLNLLTLAAWVLFLLAMKGVANYLDESGMARDAEATLTLGVLVWLGLIFGPLIGVLVIQGIGCLGIPVVLGIIVAWIVYGIRFLFRYIAFLSDMRDVVSRA
jgi:hypothetical protein